jgi:hypothetical protein
MENQLSDKEAYDILSVAQEVGVTGPFDILSQNEDAVNRFTERKNMKGSNPIIRTDEENLRLIIREEVSNALQSKTNRWFSPKEAAAYLRHHTVAEVIDLCKKGKIQFIRKGSKLRSHYLISMRSLDRYI